MINKNLNPTTFDGEHTNKKESVKLAGRSAAHNRDYKQMTLSNV
jgi:hypothetical protein